MHGAEFGKCFEIRTACSRGEGMKKAQRCWSQCWAYVSRVFGQSSDKPAAQTPAAGQAAALVAAPQGKRPAQAKTQPEYEAYNAAKALTDPVAGEKAADDFAVKFPDSELRPLLYAAAMSLYQQANNADKMMDMAKKILTYDADSPEALLGVAQVLAERTRDTDLDKDQKLAEAKKDAERALVTVETDIPTSGIPQDRLDAYKGFISLKPTRFWEHWHLPRRTGRMPRPGYGSRSTHCHNSLIDCRLPAVGRSGHAGQVSRGAEVCQSGSRPYQGSARLGGGQGGA